MTGISHQREKTGKKNRKDNENNPGFERVHGKCFLKSREER